METINVKKPDGTIISLEEFLAECNVEVITNEEKEISE